MLTKGSDIVVESLLEQGVDTIFGYPGGAILEVYDSLYKYQDKIHHVLTSHEQGASHAADGYARATGKVGVCMATSGPGATNLVTGIATAMMDSIPLVALTANVGVNALGKDAFQEIDIKGVTIPITKHNFICKSPEELAPTIRKAFQIAKEGRPGPVLVDMTKNATVGSCEYTKKVPDVIGSRNYTFPTSSIKKAVEMIEASEKPFVFVGGGCIASQTSAPLKEFVEKIDAPVTDTLMGKGAYDGTNPRYAGMLGMHGTKASNIGVSECDLLIAIGVRFSDRITGNVDTFAKNAKIIHIDVDDAEIDKNVPVDLGIVGDAKDVIEAINLTLTQQNHPGWMKEIRTLKDRYPLTYDQSRLTGPYVIEQIDNFTDSQAIITTEVGQNQMWAAQYYHYRRPRQFLSSGGLGTMGFGLPAAIGAKLANPDKKVVLFTGDGSIMMNCQEFATVADYNLDIKVVVLNNHMLGMVAQWQRMFYNHHYSHSVLRGKTDLVKLAQAMGVNGYRIDNKTTFNEQLANYINSDGACLIDILIPDEENVFPMVPAGGRLDQMVLEAEQ